MNGHSNEQSDEEDPDDSAWEQVGRKKKATITRVVRSLHNSSRKTPRNYRNENFADFEVTFFHCFGNLRLKS